MFSQMLITMFM